MKRRHRRAHLRLVVLSALLAAGFVVQAWRMRAATAPPAPIPDLNGPAGAQPSWTGTIETGEGDVLLALHPARDGGTGRLQVTLPPGLGAAEPGLLLVTRDGSERVLGSVSPARRWLSVPGTLPQGSRLVLVDLARDRRLGEAPVGGSRR